MHGHHRCRQLRRVDVDRPPHRVLADLRLQFGGRSVANGSVVSSTACTKRAELRARRRSAIGDGTSGPDILATTGMSATSSSSSMTSGSLLTPLVSAARIKPEYDVRRRAVSIARWKCRTSNLRCSARPGLGRRCHHRLLDHQGFGRFCSRAIVAVGNLHWRTAIGRRRLRRSARPRNSRDSPPLGSAHAGDHPTTTCDARVIARRSTGCRHWHLPCGPPRRRRRSRDCPSRRRAGTSYRPRGTTPVRGLGHCGRS